MTDEPTPVATIAAAEMYGELRGIHENVSLIEGKLDGIATIDDQLYDHEDPHPPS